MILKLCGITRVEDMAAAARAGADYAGMVLVPGTPRFVLRERIARLAKIARCYSGALPNPADEVLLVSDPDSIYHLNEKDEKERARYYGLFQEELARDPAYAFICYIDANYVAKSGIKGIARNTVLGHHGVGIFWNIHEWNIAR